MARFAATANGNVAYSVEREAIRDAEEAAYADSATDRAWARVREKRNQLLTESDWRGMSDLTMSDDWKTYRQALRDVGGQADPTDITWPEKPK
tara:strand:+ start:1081 stop:1359 length:279 start_codon:yes stop_codon:yes gene_type:complete